MNARVNQTADIAQADDIEAYAESPTAARLTSVGTSSKAPELRVKQPETKPENSSGLLAPFMRRRADWGLRRALYWQLMHFLARCGFRIHKVGVGSTRFDLFDPEPPEVPPGYETRPLGKTDLEPYVDKLETNLTQDFLDQAFANGDDCVGSFYGDQLVAFSFDSRTRTTVTDQLDVMIPEGFKYGYKAWTHPDHRRRNLSKMISHVKWKQVARDYGERGIWYIETHNYQSRLHSYIHPREWSIGFGYVGWFTLFGRQIPFNTRWAKKIGLEFVRKSDHRKRYYGG